MTKEVKGGGGTGIDPNVALLLGALACALVNFLAIMFLILRVLDDPIRVLGFFALVAPVAACVVAFLIHFSLEKGFHPLAITGFILFMIFAALLNFHFWGQAVAAV